MAYDKNDLYGTTPFIAYDAPDEDGVRAEVKIIMGYGVVDPDVAHGDKTLEQLGDDAYKVYLFKGNKYLEQAYVNSSKLIDMLKESQESLTPLHYRIEYQRKAKIDRSIPFNELIPPDDMKAARENGSRRLVGLKFADDEEWTYDKKMALTNPAEDKKVGGRYSAFDMEITPPKKQSNSFKPSPFTTVVNGEVNPASVGAGVATTMFFFLYEQSIKHEVLVDEDTLKELANRLLKVCDKLQQTLGGIKTVDFSDASHTRARAVVISVVQHLLPISAKALKDDKSIQEWLKSIYKNAYGMYKWSLEVAKEHCI